VFGVSGEKDCVGYIQNVEGILMNKMYGLGSGGGGGGWWWQQTCTVPSEWKLLKVSRTVLFRASSRGLAG
jgi:hypothetical protein